jgi:outer membrane protein OmpA-like peptidoglycan-associated protein
VLRRPSALAAATIVAITGILPISAILVAQDVDPTIESVDSLLEEVRRAGHHLVAPRRFERAVARLEDASARRERGDSPESVRQRVIEASVELREVRRLAVSGAELFGSALAARGRALDAGAPERADALWASAEGVLREAGLRFERDDREDASRRAERAASLYREAAFSARRDEQLGTALTARAAALGASARELAPETFGEGEAMLARADSILARGTGEVDAARRLGVEAATAFRRAARMADVTDSVARRQVAVESLIREHEGDLVALATVLGLDVSIAGGSSGVAEVIADEIRRLFAERDRLEREGANARSEGERLRERVEALERDLTAAERREAETLARLGEREDYERRLREVHALFTPEEGEVLVRGDELTLRLFQLTFESGSDEILREHQPILAKVQRVLVQFSEAPVRIEGHTDTRGNAEANRALSQRRAIAIREYLLENLPISANRLEATGYGEDRPIASNENEEGRTRNRRIEIVLTLDTR